MLVSLVCLGARDDAGRRIFRTHSYYDRDGPREIVLGVRGARQLGNMLFAAVALIGLTMLLVWTIPKLLIGAAILIGLVLSSANTAARPAITRWLDGLKAENAA